MSGTEGLNDRAHKEAQRVLDRRMRRTPIIVTAYRGDLHAIKGEIQPWGTPTGWIQIETDQVGNLVAPNIGDPGWLDFHEDDRRAAVFVGSNHNDLNPPPVEINAGERYKKVCGSTIYQKNDGSIEATDSAGASFLLRNGAITATDKAGTVISTDGNGSATVTASTAVTVKAPAINLGNGGTLLPVMLEGGAPSTVVKAQ